MFSGTLETCVHVLVGRCELWCPDHSPFWSPKWPGAGGECTSGSPELFQAGIPCSGLNLLPLLGKGPGLGSGPAFSGVARKLGTPWTLGRDIMS
jgi:hypothetical protein